MCRMLSAGFVGLVKNDFTGLTLTCTPATAGCSPDGTKDGEAVIQVRAPTLPCILHNTWTVNSPPVCHRSAMGCNSGFVSRACITQPGTIAVSSGPV